jgi:hypothetical protein
VAPYAAGSVRVRCGRPVRPGEAWDLDHSDDRAGYLGVAHRQCNRPAGGQLGAARQKAHKERTKAMVTEVALGIEIGETRDHTSIAAAGYVDGNFVLVELAAYAAGPDPVPEVLRLCVERTVRAVALDPRSPAATALGPLKAARIDVTPTERATQPAAVTGQGEA